MMMFAIRLNLVFSIEKTYSKRGIRARKRQSSRNAIFPGNSVFSTYQKKFMLGNTSANLGRTFGRRRRVSRCHRMTILKEL
jgi:hypothetical protein